LRALHWGRITSFTLGEFSMGGKMQEVLRERAAHPAV
jgi:hypothetical protein